MGETDWAMVFLIITAIWIGWPLYRISDHLKSLVELAKDSRK